MRKKLLLLLLALLTLFLSGHYAYKKREEISIWFAFHSALPEWVKSQLAQEFLPFVEQGISQEALDATYETIAQHQIPVYRYRIVGREIYRKPAGYYNESCKPRLAIYEKVLKHIQRIQALPCVDFLLCITDGVPEPYNPPRFWMTEKQAPLLCWSKMQDAPSLILVPDFTPYPEASWHRDIAAIEKQYRAIPWEEREGRAFWRGTWRARGFDDQNHSIDYHADNPRVRISLLSAEHPDLLDAKLSSLESEKLRPLFSEFHLIASPTSAPGHLQYKYLPVIDGWMSAFSAFQWRLFSGSVTFKQESPAVQYFYSALQPFVHYVPIKNDVSDLLEKIAWAKEHDQECRAIAERARLFALHNLMPMQTYSYLHWVLKRYASLQIFDHVEIDDSWTKI